MEPNKDMEYPKGGGVNIEVEVALGGTEEIDDENANIVNWSGFDASSYRPAREIETMTDVDLSTIANDLTNQSITEEGLPLPPPPPPLVSTPPKNYYQEMLIACGLSKLDDSCLPGTPSTSPGSPDVCRNLDSAELGSASSMSGKSQRSKQQPRRRCTLATIVLGMFAVFLLLVILILFYLLYQVKTGNIDSFLDFGGKTTSGRATAPTPSPIVYSTAPVAQAPVVPVAPPTIENPNESNSSPVTKEPSEEANETAHPTEYSHLGSAKRMILDLSPSSSEMIDDTSSNQYLSLLWVTLDPEFPQFSQQKLVQRWVMGVLFLSVSGYSGPLANSFDGTDLASFNSWMSYTDECTWVTTSDEPICDEQGAIRVIHLEGMGLKGTLPSEMAMLSGSLMKLNMKSNSISGSIPSEFQMLSLLTHFELNNNALSGAALTEVTHLSELEVLGLGGNAAIDGTIMDIGNLTNLVTLDMQGCNFTGPIPTEIGNLGALEFVSLSDNQLSGNVPEELANLVSLEEFSADRNALRGEIVRGVCRLDNLDILEMDCDVVKCPCCTYCCRGCSKLS